MTPLELIETWQRSPSLSQVAIARLIGDGVPPLALARDPNEFGYVVATDRVIFDGSRFEFGRELVDQVGAVSALIFAARDDAGDVADLIAARPSDGLIGSWLGQAAMLGQQYLAGPRISEGLEIHADPISWLRAGRHGVVIVDAERAKWALADAGPLLANSIEHGRALRSALTFSPDILIPTNRKLVA